MERSKQLHNFVLPNSLKWGNQRFLRCMKVNSNGEVVSSSDRRSSASECDSDEKNSRFVRQRSSSSPLKSKKSQEEDGIDSVKAKYIARVQTVAEKMQFSLPGEIHEEESDPVAASAAKPWNLRTRRAACKAPVIENHEEQKHQSSSPIQRTENQHPSPKSLRLRGLAAMAATNNQDIEKKKEKKERRKFSIALSRDEIKEDILMMTGNNPSRRPKKRGKIIQKQLDNLFPGLWLTEITADSYRVPDETMEIKKI